MLGFYLDRIADEGYLTTATQPGSILALASLVGYQPAPSQAAQAYLAYTLAPDPADGAVQFSKGLLFQSVPGPGQQPQTFESAGELVARPSWNLLAPKSTQPLPASTTSLVIGSTTAGLSPNDVILLELGTASGCPASGPSPVTVASATVDITAKVTRVTLQEPAVTPAASPAETPASSPPPAVAAAVPPAQTAVPAGPLSPAGLSPAAPPDTPATAIDTLLTGLGKTATPVPRSASDLPQTPQLVFSARSDAVPRLISALQPVVSSGLYAALGTTPIGSPAVTGASAMRVRAAPFGAAAPPQPVFSASGQPAGTRDRPIGDAFTLQLSVTAADYVTLQQMTPAPPPNVPNWLRRMTGHPQDPPEESPSPVIDVQCSTASFTSQGTITVSRLPAPVPPLSLPGFGGVQLSSGAAGTAVLTYAGFTAPATSPEPSPPSTPQLQVNASFNQAGDAVTLEFIDPVRATSLGTVVWDSSVRTPFSAQIGAVQVAIAWATSPGGEVSLTASITTPLPLPPAEQKVLRLDGHYPGIIPDSYVVIDRAGPAAGTSGPPAAMSGPAAATSGPAAATPGVPYPVVTKVGSADTIAASAYGITGKVTQLTLDDLWIDGSALLQSALRPLTVYAQPAVLALQPASVDTPVEGSSIDLDVLVAGMDPGRLIAVTGTRTDLPAGATVPSGEIAMIASVSTGGGGGETVFSTLNLARASLTYSYQRDTVKIYGNVVSAHQGATINQVLGSGQPAQAPQGPLLADALPGQPGAVPTLNVTVGRVSYTQVSRYESGTPAQSFLTGTDTSGRTTITFPAPLPAGTGNISASYRAGNGSRGNLQAGQITQLLSRPAALSAVTNPLSATGGSGGDDPESVRAAAPAALSGLGKIVTVSDYADLAKSITGVAEADAAPGPGAGVVVTIAGTDPVQLNPGDSLCSAVAAAIASAADPAIPVQVLPASLYLIALTADVVRDPAVTWDATVAAVQAALVASFGYPQRGLGQDVAVSDLLAAAHTAAGARSVTVTGLALIPASASASAISMKLPALLIGPVPPVLSLAAVPGQWKLASTAGGPAPAGVAYASDAAPGTLILSERSP